jgi:hypothetical protein
MSTAAAAARPLVYIYLSTPYAEVAQPIAEILVRRDYVPLRPWFGAEVPFVDTVNELLAQRCDAVLQLPDGSRALVDGALEFGIPVYYSLEQLEAENVRRAARR